MTMRQCGNYIIAASADYGYHYCNALRKQQEIETFFT